MKKFVFAILLAVAVNAPAYADSRADKIRTLMEAQGTLASFEQQLNSGREYGRRIAIESLDQIVKDINPDPTYRKLFQNAVDEFMGSIQGALSAQQMADAWAQYYGEAFTDEELDGLVVFYTSSLGKKDVQGSLQARAKFMEYYQAKYKEATQKSLGTYIQKLKTLADDCNCSKQ